MFVDQIPLIPDYLEDSLLRINFTVLLRNGTYQELPYIEIKPVVDGKGLRQTKLTMQLKTSNQ